ncbi:T9SS type A sorting domain-containing protein [Polaribacter sp. SA4-12]|uniref:T9SS type A sorting domain-containing protein n=1 Tax=Polaribacter sp. SA4-12 TaxID=1312072 RepID=UPI000B3CDDF3|nr:T9SS type A sorting domain-containing protein [Polaribacter sp. SA4-12]ARV14408.1 hypothetical protein BTO07_04255 [Polaribacter sp. SA4-12]
MQKYIVKTLLFILTFIGVINLNAQSYQIKEFGSKNSAKENQTKFSENQDNRVVNYSSLINYLPESGLYNSKVENVSISKELLELKNIKEILSFNYYQESEIVSSVLATKTQGLIYNHSKVICDRLNGDRLDDISTVLIKGHQIIKSTIKKASGKTTYSLRFSIKSGDTKKELFSFWTIDQYPTGFYQNYQIWGTSFTQILAIVNYTIDKHTIEKGLISKKVENILPNVFVRSGVYSNGILRLNIINKTNEREINFDGNIAETEISNHNKVTDSYSLSGDYYDTLSIETGVLFDIGFSIQVDNSNQKDVLYIAEGPWGLDYLNTYATVNSFDIDTAERRYLDDVYEVDRNAIASGEVKGNINLFRHLLPELKALNVEEYNFINFKIINNEPIEIVIMQDEDRAWENRIRYTVLANSDEKEYNISFNDFTDAAGNSVEISNIKTVVFSIIGDYTNYKPFNINLKQLSFRTNTVLAVDKLNSIGNSKLMNYPNPFTSSTTIQLPTTSEYVQIQVYDLIGRVVDAKRINTKSSSSKKVEYNAPQLKNGVYKYRLIDDKNNQHSGTFIVN